MSYVGDMGLASDVWKKFKSLYQNIGLIERDSIFICLSTQILLDFDNMAHFADNIKRNSTQPKELGTKNIPD